MSNDLADVLRRREALSLYDALEQLVAATEAADNPGDMGVSRDDDTMIAARAALAQAREERR